MSPPGVTVTDSGRGKHLQTINRNISEGRTRNEAVEHFGGVVIWPATDTESALRQKVAALEFELKVAQATPVETARRVG